MLKTTTVHASILGGALLMTGCGAGASQSADAPQSGGGKAPVASGGGSSQDIGTSNCSEEDFKVTTEAVQGATGRFVLSFENRSNEACTINGGVPNFDALDMSNSPIDDLPVEEVRQPDAPKNFTVQPGDAVYASIDSELAGTGDPDQFVVSGFQAGLPDMSEQPAPVENNGAGFELSVKSLQVSALAIAPELLP